MRKNIVVKDSNRDRINAMIHEAEGKATVRTITYEDIVSAVRKIEKTLGIHKTEMVGIVAEIDPNAQTFPNAYKYTPYSTHARIIRTATGWTLTEVCRSTTHAKPVSLILTKKAKEAIISRMEKF